MQALVLKPGAAAAVFVRDYPTPTPRAGDVLIRVRLAGVCATDLELTRGYMGFAGVLGHEFVGVVEQGPPELLGRRVVGEINCPCGACDTCRRGLPRHCPHRTVLGIAGRDGAFADYVALPAANCHVVPDHVPDEEAVFTEPLAAAIHVRDAAALTAGQRVAVLGTGRLGLLIAQALATGPAEVEVFGRNPHTLALATKLGLRAHALDVGAGESAVCQYDVVVEATGHPDGLRRALQLCRPCGAIVLKSTYAGAPPLDLAPAVIHEIRIVGSRCGPFEPALALLAARQMRVQELITAEYSLAQGAGALAAAAAPEQVKVLLRLAT